MGVELGNGLCPLSPDQEKPLNAFAGLGLTGVQVAFRVHGAAVALNAGLNNTSVQSGRDSPRVGASQAQ